MMEIAQSRKNCPLSLPWLFALLGGVSGLAQAQTPGYTIINPDGTRTHVQGAYKCPAGYTCTALPVRSAARSVVAQPEVNQDQIGNATTSYTSVPVYYSSPAPVYYYGYPPTYVGVPSYVWPPLFFGFGYYWGGHHHHHHTHPHSHSHPHPRTPPPPAPAPRR